jgi:hypothetical protein
MVSLGMNNSLQDSLHLDYDKEASQGCIVDVPQNVEVSVDDFLGQRVGLLFISSRRERHSGK